MNDTKKLTDLELKEKLYRLLDQMGDVLEEMRRRGKESR